MKTSQSLPLALIFLLAACGGSSTPPASAPPAHEEHEGHEGHEGHEAQEAKEHHHEGGSPAVHDFHEVLAPLWHSDKGPERAAKTCAQAQTLKDKAAATNDAELVTATAALEAECKKDGRPDFEARFAAVHESFHGVAARAKH